MVYNVVTHKLDQIPSLMSRKDNLMAEQAHCGIHSVQINPSRTLLATGARNTCDIAVYRLPTLDPVCVGENAHKDWVFDMFEHKTEVPMYHHISAISVKDCRNSQRVGT
jgi:WD repeat-containing protein 40A